LSYCKTIIFSVKSKSLIICVLINFLCFEIYVNVLEEYQSTSTLVKLVYFGFPIEVVGLSPSYLSEIESILGGG
jgi:hypothetical protein